MENIDKEKLREAEREVARLERNHEEHLKLVRKSKEGMAIGLTFAIIGATAFGISAIEKKRNEIPTPIQPKISYIQEDQDFLMVRYYTVQFNDTLIGISKKTGIDVDTIAYDNGIDNPNLVDLGKNLRLNYRVNPEDLEYYTDKTDVNGRNVPELAGDYYTTIDTICRLNPESIINHGNGNYEIVSNTVTIPKFITPQELAMAKEGYRR